MRSSLYLFSYCRYTVEYFSPNLQTGWIVAAHRVGDTQVTVRLAMNNSTSCWLIFSLTFMLDLGSQTGKGKPEPTIEWFKVPTK